jgi:hypothetical protein
MMNARDNSYARYITIGALMLLIITVSIWIYRSIPESDTNQNPKVGFVCMDTGCNVKKKCDTSTLIIYTMIPDAPEPLEQRVSNSYECQ